MNYAFDMSGIYYNEMDYNISMSAYYPMIDFIDLESDVGLEKQQDIYEYFQNIADRHNIEEFTIKRNINLKADLSKFITDTYKVEDENFDPEEITIPINSVGKDAYKKFLKEIGGKYDDYKDGIIYCDNHGNLEKRLNIKTNNIIKGKIQETKESLSLKVLKVTDKVPMATSYSPFGTFIISDELMDKIGKYHCYSMKVNADNATKLCEKIEKERQELDASEEELELHIINYQEDVEEQKRMGLLISIFLYGFITVISLIGVTNIFNTITTNMNLRSKEFAMLKAIGMTNKEFNKMIRLESIFYGVKSLFIGIALGLGISYCMYKVVIGAEATNGLGFIFPTGAVIISIVFISIIIGIIMKYSLSKINKQNIIETIRSENI